MALLSGFPRIVRTAAHMLASAILSALTSAALIGSLGYTPFAKWVDSTTVKESFAYLKHGHPVTAFNRYWKGVIVEDTALFIFFFVITLSFFLYFLRPKTIRQAPHLTPKDEPAQHEHPKPTPHIENVPFRKLTIGSIEERVGRDEGLAWLKKRLIDEPTNSVAVASLQGGGGMGKTFLANVFAAGHRKDVNFLEIYVGERPALDAGIEFLTKLRIDTSRIDSLDALKQAMAGIYSESEGVVILDDVWKDDVEGPDAGHTGLAGSDHHQGPGPGQTVDRKTTRSNWTPSVPMNPWNYSAKCLAKNMNRKRKKTTKIWPTGWATGLMESGWRPNLSRNRSVCPRRRPCSMRSGKRGWSHRPNIWKRTNFPLANSGPCWNTVWNSWRTSPQYARELLNYLATCDDEGMEVRFFLDWMSHVDGAAPEQVEHELTRAQNLGLLLLEETRSDVPWLKEVQPEKRIRLHTDLLFLLREEDLTKEAASLHQYLYATLVQSPGDMSTKMGLQKLVYGLFVKFKNSPDDVKKLYHQFMEHLYRTGRLLWAFELGETYLRSLGECESRERGSVIGHQALILKSWGRLKEAMTFHRKEEKIFRKLGDRRGLAICYGNQAYILKARGPS